MEHGRLNLSGPLIWSLVFITLAAVFLANACPSLLAATFGAGTGEARPESQFAMLMQHHEEVQTTYQTRFDGRSVFFKPRPPRRPPPRREIEPEEDPPPYVAPPPSIPSTYSGPSIVAFVDNAVWFHGELRISVGEEAQGVRVLEVNPPWSAKLAYNGGEFDVPLFEKGPEAIFKEPTRAHGTIQGMTITEPPAETPAEDEADPEADKEGGEEIDDELPARRDEPDEP